MVVYEKLVAQLDERVEALFPQQVMDRSHKDCGGFVSAGYGMVGGSQIGSVQVLGYAWLSEGSRYYGNPDILERLLLAAQYCRHARRPSGLFDLVTTDWDSGPYTAFLVQALAPMVRAARKSSLSWADEVAAEWGEIIQVTGPPMATGGFNTPNHRWVLTGALAQTLDLFPELNLLPAIDSYLAETIDINPDGEYTERSTGVYNAICNRSLRLTAELLDRPELYDPVRHNLDTSYHLLHADGSVVTSLSRRQDKGTKVVPHGMVDSYYTLARLDGNGLYASVADWLAGFDGAGLPWSLEPFLTHPEWREDDLPREPMEETYRKFYSTSGVWRARDGKMSATAATGINTPFSLKYGDAALSGVQICGCYFGLAQFLADELKQLENGVELYFAGKGRRHDGPIYYHPVGRPVSMDDYMDVRLERDVTVLAPLEMKLTILEVDGGFDLKLWTSEPFDEIPVQIALDFTPGGEFDFDNGAVQAVAGETFFLRSGKGIYHVGQDAISISPGCYAHRMWQMRNSEPVGGQFRVLLTMTTPVEQTVEIRCGKWDEMMMDIA
jgi:hypothetical protein